MRCPLCGGPLHVDEAEHFVCERGHDTTPEQLQAAALHRVTIALWMAIEALETEAQALQMLAASNRGDGSAGLAEQAEKDALVLRTLVTSHTAAAGVSSGDEQ